nr:HAD-IC family P-type ATPase [Candidatus Magasanikbacteria bacterium]
MKKDTTPISNSVWPIYSALSVEKTLQEQGVASEGLRSEEIYLRQNKNGPNELGEQKVRWYHVLGRQFASPFIYILLATVPLSIIFGETIDAVMIILFIVINVALGFTQEYRSEKMLATLSSLVVAKARVMRNGKEEMVASRELVPGDIVILQTGDIVPADARIIETKGLTVNETVLTGESIAVNKDAEVVKNPKDVYDGSNMVFSGTTIVEGKAMAVVIGTGGNSVMGGIAHLAADTVRESGFEKGIKSLSTFILRLIFGTLILVFIANVLIKDASRADLVELIIFSIALAISVIPEALPVVTTFSLSRGALHLAKKKVVVKRLSAIEDLGGIEILCSDKTGTITENELTVAEVLTFGDYKKEEVIMTAAEAAPFLHETGKQANNAFDVAIAKKLSKKDLAELSVGKIIADVPFDPARRRNVVLCAIGTGSKVIVRGAFVEVAGLSTNVKPTDKAVLAWLEAEGKKGRRVIMVAAKKGKKTDVDDLMKAENGVEAIGLISFVDPLKPTSKAAIANARALNVAFKIITGDGPEVAEAIGREVGLVTESNQVITAADLLQLPEHEQLAVAENTAVFARVNPSEKYRIIQLLQSRHQVGFLGEGINDAPALKIAQVGLVVAEASDVAREAADIVLLEKSLSVIIDGIREGRMVFVNTLTYIKSTLASNLGNFYAVAVASLLIDFLPMLPLQILLLNLLSDFPMIAIATDRVDQASIKNPKQYDIKEIALVATVLGLVSSLFDFIYFAYFKGQGPMGLQTNWFMGSIITELLFLFSIRTRGWSWKARRPSGTILWLTVSALVLTLVLPLMPWAREIFKFSLPTRHDYIAVIIIAVLYFI